jgi:hypothetical protein
MRRMTMVALLLALAGMGCGKSGGDSSKALTERQRDSILAGERLPGAEVVGKALAVSDSAAQRAARMDSLP